MSNDMPQLYEREEPTLSDWEMNLYESVSQEAPWELIEQFADLRRISPSDDEKEAARQLMDRFEEYGITYDRYDPELWLSVPNEASIRSVPDEDLEFHGQEPAFDMGGAAVKALAFSGSGTVSGEVVRLEMPNAENVDEILGENSLDLSQYDLGGKIVLIDAMILAKGFFRRLEEHGAVGLISIHPTESEPHISTAMPIWGAIPDIGERERIPDMHNVTVSREVGGHLLDYITESEHPELEITTDLAMGWFECPLVVAQIPAGSESETDDFVLLHGHLDSWYYGVTDNATGNAAMVECARILNEHRVHLKRNLWIAFWPGHEGGRYGGSSWFVDEFASTLVDHCIAHVNCDSPGVANATEFEMTMWNAEGAPLCQSAIDDVAGKTPRDKRPPRAADYSFFNLGISGVLGLSSSIPQHLREKRNYHPVGGSGGNSQAWHRTTDTLEKADPDVLVRDIRVYLIVLARLLTDDIVPLDYRRTLADHRDALTDYHEAGDDQFDLTPILTELDHLASAIDTLYQNISEETVEPAVANDALINLSRRLIPLEFTEKGRFKQDPAEYLPPYPTLRPIVDLADVDGNDDRFQLVQLKRAQNAVCYELRTARRELQQIITQ